MKKSLPPRPNLDHLRRQAKALLAAIEVGNPEAIATIREHLPSARGWSAEQVRAAKLRLADAQAAVARHSDFASWPRLARHVEQLRALEGTWAFERLEVDGREVPPEGLSRSRLLIDGDRFRTESPEETYEGTFNIDVEADPHGIDIEFVEGPEAGNWNYGIFRLEGDRLDLCLDMSGQGRPGTFGTTPGSQHAFETLRRENRDRPEAVTGGSRRPRGETTPAAMGPADPAAFAYVPSPLLERLQGEWTAERLVRDGQEMPAVVVGTGRRVADRNEVKVWFGGQLIVHALVRLDESADPVRIEYCNIGGMAKGTVQRGIMRWRGEVASFCMAAPGQPPPDTFDCPAGSGRTLTEWRLKP